MLESGLNNNDLHLVVAWGQLAALVIKHHDSLLVPLAFLICYLSICEQGLG